MTSILNKIKDFVGISEVEEYEEEEERVESSSLKPNFSTVKDTNIPFEAPKVTPRRSKENFNVTTETKSLGTSTSMVSSSKNNNSNVIGLPQISSNTVTEVVVMEPHKFDEMPQVIRILRERKSVILNLNVMDPDEAQRSLDFVAGGTHAIDGHQERVGERIFLFTPNCVKVSNISGKLNVANKSSARPNSLSAPSTNLWEVPIDSEFTRLAQ
jgi:cell division inhibitor SepF